MIPGFSGAGKLIRLPQLVNVGSPPGTFVLTKSWLYCPPLSSPLSIGAPLPMNTSGEPSPLMSPTWHPMTPRSVMNGSIPAVMPTLTNFRPFTLMKMALPSGYGHEGGSPPSHRSKTIRSCQPSLLKSATTESNDSKGQARLSPGGES